MVLKRTSLKSILYNKRGDETIATDTATSPHARIHYSIGGNALRQHDEKRGHKDDANVSCVDLYSAMRLVSKWLWP